MPWQEVSTMSLRTELVMLAMHEGVSVAGLSRRFGISRKTAYKYLRRYAREGLAGLVDRSRRPHRSPRRTVAPLKAAIIRVRQAHPAWGARKIKRRLLDLGHPAVPAASTIQVILQRHGLIDSLQGAKHRPFVRFESDAPNRLWQMDFKGHVPMAQGRCHPLTVLDDHSRYNLLLKACADERTQTVKDALTATFRRYGLPARMLMDNGSPWGNDAQHRLTPLGVWLLRLDISLVHARPYHPQTVGKDERFHRTLNVECLNGRTFANLMLAQACFDRFRDSYNLERPHEALNLDVPATRYRPSERSLPEQLPAIEYEQGEVVRKVQDHGKLSYRGYTLRVPKALKGYPVALRPTETDGHLAIYFRHYRIAEIDFRNLTK